MLSILALIWHLRLIVVKNIKIKCIDSASIFWKREKYSKSQDRLFKFELFAEENVKFTQSYENILLCQGMVKK